MDKKVEDLKEFDKMIGGLTNELMELLNTDHNEDTISWEEFK